MKDSTIEAIVWLVATGIAATATLLAARAAGMEGVPVEALPPAVVVIMLCGWLVRDTRWVVPVLVQVPMIVAIVGTISNDSVRMLGCGVGLAFAVGAALFSRASSGGLDRFTGSILLAATLMMFRLIGVPQGRWMESVLIVAGCVVLLAAIAHGRNLTAGHWLVVFATGVAVPLYPSRLAVVPLLFSAIVWLGRSSRIPTPLATVVVLAIVAGRWAWPLALAGAAIHLAVRRPRSAEAPATFLPGLWASSIQSVLRTAAFVIAGAGAVKTAPAAGVIAIALIAGGMLLRPALAILYAIAAAVLLVARVESDDRRHAGPAAVMASLMIAMFAWSGALIATFPLPVSSLAVGVIVIGAAATMFRSAVWPTYVLALGALVAALFLPAPGALELEPANAVLRPGESVNLTPASTGNEATLTISGGNLLGMRAGHPVADVDVISVRGRAYRRSLSAGEVNDWAGLRQEHWFVSEHGVPSRPVGPLSDYGASSYLIGAGSIEIATPEMIGLIRVTMRNDLGEGAALHVDGFRVGTR